MTGAAPGRRVSAAEIAALTHRLRALSAAGRNADEAERAAFLADKQTLLDRITDHDQHPNREAIAPTDDRPPADRSAGAEVVPGPAPHRHNVFENRAAGSDGPGPVFDPDSRGGVHPGDGAAPAGGDGDGWISAGYEAAHQAHLDYLAGGGDRAADTRDAAAAREAGEQAAGAGAGWWDTEAGQARIAEWARETADPERMASGRQDRAEEIAARIQEICDQLHTEALAEDARRTSDGGASRDSGDDIGDGAGWSR